jgi:hypothetical protein
MKQIDTILQQAYIGCHLQQATARAVHLGELLTASQTMYDGPPRYPVTCEIDGNAHRGTYWIAGKILTVSTGNGGKSRQVGTSLAEDLAKQLLQELAKEGKA